MELLFEDDHLIVVNKLPGMITEGVPKGKNLSLSDRIEAQNGLPVYACHRLDKDTTGVVVFAKSKIALKQVFSQFSERKVRKLYLVRVDGVWESSWNRVDTLIARDTDGRMKNSDCGKKSLTTFRRLATWDKFSLLEALPKSGRTHQIRLHCLHHSCPVSGDGMYGLRDPDQPPMALHARQLFLKHPLSGKSLILEAPLPEYWRSHWLKGCPVELT